MAETVPAEPVYYDAEAEEHHNNERAITTSEDVAVPFGRGGKIHEHEQESECENVAQPFESGTLPPTLDAEIQPFLRVANLIQTEEPHVAYLCRFHAFELAHTMDPTSIGKGVRQFKTSLLQRLEQDYKLSREKRKRSSDICSLRRAYHAYKDNINNHDGVFDSKVISDISKTIAIVIDAHSNNLSEEVSTQDLDYKGC